MPPTVEDWQAIRQAYALIFYGLVERVDGKYWRVFRVSDILIRVEIGTKTV